jgi:hypothetical protein
MMAKIAEEFDPGVHARFGVQLILEQPDEKRQHGVGIECFHDDNPGIGLQMIASGASVQGM